MAQKPKKTKSVEILKHTEASRKNYSDDTRPKECKPTIGLLLVKEKNKTLAKYALAGYTKPMGVAEWERQITESLPENLKSSLPTIEEIEAELSADEDEEWSGKE